jgi:hypothetical protein
MDAKLLTVPSEMTENPASRHVASVKIGKLGQKPFTMWRGHKPSRWTLYLVSTYY